MRAAIAAALFLLLAGSAQAHPAATTYRVTQFDGTKVTVTAPSSWAVRQVGQTECPPPGPTNACQEPAFQLVNAGRVEAEVFDDVSYVIVRR